MRKLHHSFFLVPCGKCCRYLFDEDFALSDEDNSKDNEDNCIHRYLGSSFFTAVEPGDQELQDNELADNEVDQLKSLNMKRKKLAEKEEMKCDYH